MRYKVLLLDVDQTVLDFGRCEREAFFASMKEAGFYCDGGIYRDYSSINDSFWKMHERKEISKADLKRERFKTLFSKYSIVFDPAKFAYIYEENLCQKYFYIDGAKEFLEDIYQKIDIRLITNGTVKAQTNRIKGSGLDRYVNGIYISDAMGCQKPGADYFEMVYADLRGAGKEQIVVMGDSLTSDIKGGADFGLDTILFDPGKSKRSDEVKPTYVAGDYEEAKKIILSE